MTDPQSEIPVKNSHDARRRSLGLFFWQFKKLGLLNFFAVLAVGSYVLLRVTPFTCHELVLLLGVLLHCWLIAWRLWRSSPRQSGFLYSWGFTRDEIWWQTYLASLASAALVCGVAWLLMVLQVRFLVQDGLVANPYFLVPQSGEYWVPWFCFYGYLLVLPMLHYAWVRSKHSAKGKFVGWMIMFGGLVLLVVCFVQSTPTPTEVIFRGRQSRPTPWLFVLAALFIPSTLCWIAMGKRLHGTMEARG